MAAPLLRDVRDLEAAVALAVADAPLVPGLVLVLQDLDLRALGVPDDAAGDGDLLEVGRRAEHGAAVDDEHGLQVDRVTVEELHVDDVADRDLVLLAAGLHDRVHLPRGLLSARASGSRA